MTAPGAKTIDYYLTVNSPWAFLGSARLRALADASGVGIRVRPVDFHKIFDATGGLPLPKRSPQRQAYRLVELKRWAEQTGEAVVMKPSHPVDPTRANLAVLAVRDGGGDAAAAAHAIGRAFWVEDRDIADETELVAILDSLGVAGSAAIGRVRDDDALAARYEAETEDAIAAGVFGAPWYVFDGEPFWGQDRLDFLARRLGVTG